VGRGLHSRGAVALSHVSAFGDTSTIESFENRKFSAGIPLGLLVSIAHRRGEGEMTRYLSGVLTVIAAGVLLVAYVLINPRTVVDASGSMSSYGRSGAGVEALARDAAYGGVVYVPAAQGQQVQGYVAQPAAAPAFVPVSYVAQSAPAAPIAFVQPAPTVTSAARPVQTVAYEPAPAPRVQKTTYVERAPKRDWKRTALIIGGSSAAGAGIGAMAGGKKGALIGAAIGGGASTAYQVMKKGK